MCKQTNRLLFLFMFDIKKSCGRTKKEGRRENDVGRAWPEDGDGEVRGEKPPPRRRLWCRRGGERPPLSDQLIESLLRRIHDVSGDGRGNIRDVCVLCPPGAWGNGSWRTEEVR